MDQRRRQPEFRISSCRGRIGLQLVGEQPGFSTEQLVQRSREQPPRRNILRKGRCERRAVRSDHAADQGRPRTLCSPPRARVQQLRAHSLSGEHEARTVRAAERPDQAFEAEAQKSVDDTAAIVGHGVCGMGARRNARPVGRLLDNRDRPADRSDAGSQPVEREIRRACGLRGSSREAGAVDRGPPRIPRPARHARCAGGARSEPRVIQQHRSGVRSVQRTANQLRACPRGEHGHRSSGWRCARYANSASTGDTLPGRGLR